MNRGISLPGVLALCLFLFVLGVGLQRNLDKSRQRLVRHKNQQVAAQLAKSGVDLVEQRIRVGRLGQRKKLSGTFQEGRFEVVIEKIGTKVKLSSVGVAGRETHSIKREFSL